MDEERLLLMLNSTLRESAGMGRQKNRVFCRSKKKAVLWFKGGNPIKTVRRTPSMEEGRVVEKKVCFTVGFNE